MNKNLLKRIVDLVLSVLMVLLMSFQLTGSFLHEWFGVSMTAVVIFHNILNIRWYGSLFKGKYNPNRVLLLIINLGVVISFVLTALSGMSMSVDAVPFMNGLIPNMTARTLHLAMSYWAMIFIALHVGLHWGLILNLFDGKKSKGVKPSPIRMILTIAGAAYAAFGLFVFIRDDIPGYLSFQSHFAMYDYDKSTILVLFEVVAMMTTFVFLGYEVNQIIKKTTGTSDRWKRVTLILAVILIGITSGLLSPARQNNAGPDWSAAPVDAGSGTSVETSEPAPAGDMILVKGGSFEMGSTYRFYCGNDAEAKEVVRFISREI